MFKKALICIFGLLLLSCTKEGDTVYVVDEIEKDSRPIVWFVSKQGSLGDNGYVDSIFLTWKLFLPGTQARSQGASPQGRHRFSSDMSTRG